MVETTSENHDELVNFCSECGGMLISIEEKGETVCRQCGLIYNERELDVVRPGYRTYSKQDTTNKVHNGSPITELLPDIGLTTFINRNDSRDPELRRIIRRDSYLEWKARNHLIATNELKRVAHNLHVSEDIKKMTMKLYKKAYRLDLVKGRSIPGMVSACLYHMCKLKKSPRAFDEIIRESSVSEEMVKSCYKVLVKKLHLKTSSSNPVLYLPRFVSNLGLNFEVEKVATKILQSYFEKNKPSGLNPKGFCAGAIYLASKLKSKKITQNQIAREVGISEVSLRSRYNDLLNSIDLFFKGI